MYDDTSQPKAFDPKLAREVSRRNMPHWRQESALYLVTFRLADSLPADKLKQWRHEREQWLQRNPPPHTPARHREEVAIWDERINRWLDAGHGCCCLADVAASEQVERALRHFEGERYELGDFVVMPNHVHVLVASSQTWELSKILHSWKSFTAHQINALLGRTGSLWQDESFDHIVRSDESWAKFSRYVKRNFETAPLGKARLGCGFLTVPS